MTEGWRAVVVVVKRRHQGQLEVAWSFCQSPLLLSSLNIGFS